MIRTVVLLMFFMVAFAACQFVKPLESKSEPLAPPRSELRLSEVSNAIFSFSGEFVAVQAPSKFYLLPTGNLFESFKTLEDYRAYRGTIIGFLPSDRLVYSDGGEIFRVDAAGTQAEKLFDKSAAVRLADQDVVRKEFVIVSEDLIVTGDGNYDWGEAKGNIFLYDLKEKKVTKGPSIPAFWYASRSPDARYVLYEHGAEANNNVEIYDVLSNRNFAVSEYFNFRKAFPTLRATDEMPIDWLSSAEQFLAIVEPSGEDDLQTVVSKLVLFDVPKRQIIWKTDLKAPFFPSAFQEISNRRALLCLDDGVYDLSLLDGSVSKVSDSSVTQCSISRDRKEFAFVESNVLKVVGTEGRDERKVVEIPADWKHAADYKGMGSRPPLWSPKSDSIVLFGVGEILMIRR
jgi:hypothetical protein